MASKNGLLATGRTPRHYMKHPKDAFMHGFYQIKKTEHLNHKKYNRYHYFLPTIISEPQKLLRDYYGELDQEQNFIPEPSRRRPHPALFFETAIQCLNKIRTRLDVGDGLIAGSQILCPIPWAIFGTNRGNRTTFNEFKSFESIFQKYDLMMRPVKGHGYNVTSVLRPFESDESNDALLKISHAIDASPNYVLGCAIMLLYDLVHNCGPDCQDFPEVYSNDKRIVAINPEVEQSWINARSKVIKVSKIDFGPFLGKSSKYDAILPQKLFDFRGPLKQREQTETKFDTDVYCHVELIDVPKSIMVNVNMLEYGEKVELHEEIKKEVKKKLKKKDVNSRSSTTCEENHSSQENSSETNKTVASLYSDIIRKSAATLDSPKSRSFKHSSYKQLPLPHVPFKGHLHHSDPLACIY